MKFIARIALLFLVLAAAVTPLGASESTSVSTNAHWAFRPIVDPAPPVLRHRRWANNDMDRFLFVRLEAAGRDPAAPADKRTLIRRAAFDLTGLPPTPREVDFFLRDTSPGAFENLVERLLASPHYGERWGRHWLDVVRYADTAGENSDFPIPQAFRYRNYVIDSFTADKPYDEFIREQIAGDLLPATTQAQRNEQTIATGFIAISRRFGGGPGEPHLTIEDTLETTSRAVLGLSLSCARCHDHKHDPVTMEDYYGLYGIFASTRYPHPGAEGKNRQADFVPLVSDEELEERLTKRREQFAAVTNEIARIEKEMGALRKEGLSTASLQTEFDQAWKRRDELSVWPTNIPNAYAVSEGTPTNAPIQRRGVPWDTGPQVPRRFLKLLGGQAVPPTCSGSGRRELADWLTDPRNPLTARVMVNRIWQHHFGRGLVATPNDFGTHGSPPSHPELLDWLASRFIESGWSVKAMHRLIMGSAAYRQSSAVFSESVFSNQSRQDAPSGSLNTGSLNTDYFSPFPRRRLSAEELRDALLAVSGQLERTPGGAHPFPPEHTWEFTQHNQFNAVFDSNKRSVYLMQQRIKKHPFLALFDGADPNASTGERGVTTTPLQALFAMNDKFSHEQARAFARRLLRESATDRERIDRAFQLAFARRPGAEESAEGMAYLRRVREAPALGNLPESERQLRAWSSYARALLGSNEFLFID